MGLGKQATSNPFDLDLVFVEFLELELDPQFGADLFDGVVQSVEGACQLIFNLCIVAGTV